MVGATWLGYTYQWDAFGRLSRITNRSSPPQIVAEYRYAADNSRIAWKYPQRSGDDGWYFPVYDHSWRMIALYKRNANTSAPFTDLHERFYYHNAGLAGGGGSMYIDSVIMRDDQLTSGSLSRTMLYAQNWRGDVVGMLRYDGSPYEHVRYSAYGRPVGIAASDWDGDGVYETQDISEYTLVYASDPWGDINLDGVRDSLDIFAFLSDWFEHSSGGRDKLHSGSKNRIGYAGYQHDDVIPHMQLARHRWYRADLQTWTRRDPLGEVDGPNLYQYVMSNPVDAADPSGLKTSKHWRLLRLLSDCNKGKITKNPCAFFVCMAEKIQSILDEFDAVLDDAAKRLCKPC